MPPTRPSPITRSPLTWADLFQDLLWPRLFRAAALAAAPSRIGLALCLVVIVGALDRGWHAAFGGPAPGPISAAVEFHSANVSTAARAAWRLDGPAVGSAVYDTIMGGPAAQLRADPYPIVILLPLLLVIVPLFAGAIARSAACEFSLGIRLKWTDALGFALARWWSLIAAFAAPLIAVWIVSALLCAVGWLAGIAVVNILVGLAFVLVLLVALLAALVMFGFCVSHPLLIASVACEGTDAYDAIQRAYSYTLTRFGRLVMYILILVAHVAITLAVLAAILTVVGLLITRTTALPPASPPERVPIAVVPAQPPPVVESEPLPARTPTAAQPPAPQAPADPQPGWTERSTARIVNFWFGVAGALVIAYAVSLWMSGCTIVYLLMRQVCDGQDAAELWMPGMVDGTLAPLADAGPAAPEQLAAIDD